MSGERRFPILALEPDDPSSVPWTFVAPHEAQARTNHGGQDLERLASRGGLSMCELHAVCHDRHFHYSVSAEEATAWLVAALEAAP